MFTGIIENIGVVTEILQSGTNKTFWIESPLSPLFKIDQSVSHSGVCLTVEEVKGSQHRVTAIDETLRKTNLGELKNGSIINLERCLKADGRLDGHFVQGHVDCIGICTNHTEKKGSWEFTIEFPVQFASLVIEKGSISLNGISLTVFHVTNNSFNVALIPYTFEHTNIQQITIGGHVNLEFDMIGKYINRVLALK